MTHLVQCNSLGYRVSNTNGNSYQRSCVRIYKEGVMIAEQFINKMDSLGYLLKYRGKHWHEVKEQCLDSGMPIEHWKELFGE